MYLPNLNTMKDMTRLQFKYWLCLIDDVFSLFATENPNKSEKASIAVEQICLSLAS